MTGDTEKAAFLQYPAGNTVVLASLLSSFALHYTVLLLLFVKRSNTFDSKNYSLLCKM